jgi:hypothetical protein
VYGSRLAGHRGGNASTGQRNRHRLVPASSGAKAPLACEGRTLVRVCPRVVSGCRSRQATPGSREACLPLAAGRVDGDLASGRLARVPGGERGGEIWNHGGQAVSPAKSRAGRPRGRCGARVLARWKASRVVHELASFTRSGQGRSRRPPAVSAPREWAGPGGGGDRDVRGTVGTRHDGKSNAHRDEPETGTCDPPKRIALM